MKAYYCHHFVLPLPDGHSFPMSKYARLQERVVAMAPALGIELHEPPAATDEELARAHDPEYIRAMSQGTADAALMRRIGFPWSAAMVERSRRSSGGTMMALRDAVAGEGIAVNLAGGTHHAGPARGGGYCVFNDAAVAARYVQANGWARRVLVVDLDVHQGDGTALIAAGDDTLFTFSMHSARNYPAVKPASDLDVALPDGTGDEAYLAALDDALATLECRFAPQFVIYL
ncbi:MAG: histone deacetylase, partial [Pseudoxanthomonas sp.]|nr:histone deacetylase [Pseudoxanthomonas sp.]